MLSYSSLQLLFPPMASVGVVAMMPYRKYVSLGSNDIVVSRRSGQKKGHTAMSVSDPTSRFDSVVTKWQTAKRIVHMHKVLPMGQKLRIQHTVGSHGYIIAFNVVQDPLRKDRAESLCLPRHSLPPISASRPVIPLDRLLSSLLPQHPLRIYWEYQSQRQHSGSSLKSRDPLATLLRVETIGSWRNRVSESSRTIYGLSVSCLVQLVQAGNLASLLYIALAPVSAGLSAMLDQLSKTV